MSGKTERPTPDLEIKVEAMPAYGKVEWQEIDTAPPLPVNNPSSDDLTPEAFAYAIKLMEQGEGDRVIHYDPQGFED